MPYWGIKWGSRTGNILRIGYTAAGAEKTTHTKASFDNIRIYEMSSYSESDFTNQPKIIENENSVYTVSDNKVTVYSEFSAKVSEIATDKNASIKVYTDSTLVNRMSGDEQLGNGNVIAISNGNGVFYYDVKSVSSGNNHFVYADTKEQWTSLNTTNALTDNPIGKPAGDGALNLSPSNTESIKCWNAFDGNGNVITEFNAFGEQNANINVSVGSLNFGSISIDSGKWNKVTLFANSSEGIKLYVNGNVIKSDSKMPDLANASFNITSDKNILIDDLKSFATNLNGEISYSPGIVYENENSGMPTFVFIHVPIENTIGRDIEIWENSQLRQQALKDILAKHPTSIVVSGHSHFALNNEWTWTIDGGGISPSYVHDGGFQSQKIPVEGDGSGDITEYENATCVYAEIYSDKVVTRGYDIMKGKFIPLATSQITRNEDSTIGEISVSKVVEGNIVHLKAECDDDVSFEWSAADGTTKGDILSVSAEYDGFVAVRATKSATDYRSVSFKSVDEIEVGSFETPDYAEGRTDCIITASSDDTYKLFNGQANGTFEYVTGIGGKSFSDESGKNAIESCGRVWSYPAISSSDNGLRYWKKQNANSKYLVFSMNVMPSSEDTVYALIGTNGGSPTTAKSTDNLNKYQWNKLVGVYNIAFGTIDTYLNGKLVSDDVTTTFSSGKDIRITFEGSSYLTTDDFDITGYIDDVEIYETEKLPLLLWSEGAKDIYSGSGITVDEQNGKITLSDSMTVKEFTDITGMTISGKDGLTKAENEVIQKGDFAVFYDNSAKAYSYYEVNFGYSIAFTSGVENNVITGEKVSSNVSVTDAGVVFIAQYDNEHNFINVQIADVVKGNNTIEFNKASNAKYVRIFAMNSKSKLVPVGKQTELTVK